METTPTTSELPPIFWFESTELFVAARSLGQFFAALELGRLQRRVEREAMESMTTILQCIGAMTLPRSRRSRDYLRNKLRERLFQLSARLVALRQDGIITHATAATGRALVQRCDGHATTWMTDTEPQLDADVTAAGTPPGRAHDAPPTEGEAGPARPATARPSTATRDDATRAHPDGARPVAAGSPEIDADVAAPAATSA